VRALVMPVTIVRAGKCVPTFIALETNGWRGRVLDRRSRGGRKRRWIRVLEYSRSDKRRRGDVLDLIRLTVVTLLALLLLMQALLLLLLMRRVGLERWWLWITG
jgi:hypothetical protein